MAEEVDPFWLDDSTRERLVEALNGALPPKEAKKERQWVVRDDRILLRARTGQIFAEATISLRVRYFPDPPAPTNIRYDQSYDPGPRHPPYVAS